MSTSDLSSTTSISLAPFSTAYLISAIRASIGVSPAGKPAATIANQGNTLIVFFIMLVIFVEYAIIVTETRTNHKFYF